MIQKRWIRHTALAAILVLPVLTAGCGLFSQQTSKSIDPPKVEVTEEVEGEPTGQVDPTGKTGSNMTIYLQDINGYVAPVAVPLTLGENETAAQKALEMMVDNGAYASLLPADFRALIPQGTQVLSYQYDKEQKVAKVNFSNSFVDYNLQDERAIVEAITWTLTAMPGIEGVELSVEGELLQEMPVAAYPIEGKLTRAIGINLETAEGVNVSNSSPVTLYFSAQTLNQEQYYVPVTRLVARSDSTAHAAMEQLLAGPLNKKELTSVIMPDVKVKEIVEKNGVVTIDLQDDAYETGQQIPSEMLDALVLSLTENTDSDTVQIRVNGETNLVDEKINLTASLLADLIMSMH